MSPSTSDDPQKNDKPAAPPKPVSPVLASKSVFFIILLGVMLAIFFGSRAPVIPPKAAPSEPSNVPLYLAGVVFGLLCIYWAYKLFFLPRTRLSEWFATLLVVGVTATAVVAFLDAAETISTVRPWCVGLAMAAVLLASGVGWNSAEAMDEQRSAVRWRILIAHWLAAAGFAASVAAYSVSIWRVPYRDSLLFPVTLLVFGILCVPAFLEYRRRQRYQLMHPRPVAASGPGVPHPIVNVDDEGKIPLLTLVFLPLIWFFVPSAVRRQRYRLHSNWVAIDAGEVPEDARAHLESFDAALATHGFQALGFCRGEDNAVGFERMWTHPRLGLAHLGWAVAPAKSIRSDYVVFETNLLADFSIVTTGHVGLLITDKRKDANCHLIVFGEKSVDRMVRTHAAHQAHALKSHPGPLRNYESAADVAAWFNEWHELETQALLARGFHCAAPEEEKIRPTWRTTFIWSIIGVPPILPIWKWLLKRRMNRKLQSLGYQD